MWAVVFIRVNYDSATSGVIQGFTNVDLAQTAAANLRSDRYLTAWVIRVS